MVIFSCSKQDSVNNIVYFLFFYLQLEKEKHVEYTHISLEGSATYLQYTQRVTLTRYNK